MFVLLTEISLSQEVIEVKFIKVLMILCVLSLSISGCVKDMTQKESKGKNQALQNQEQKVYAESKEIAECYHDIYTKGYQNQNLNSVEVKQEIIDCIGKKGIAVTDTENQINMVNPKQVENFCEAAKNAQKAETTIFLVMDNGGFIRYDLKAQNGSIDVDRSSLYWEENQAKADYFEEFKAYTWMYTEKGYLFIEQYHMEGYDGAPGQTAIRVKPLDQICRELNQKYVRPVGYERNKLFITDWNECNYDNLDFYDLYEIMYHIKYGTDVPYDSGYGGAEYEIPKDKFEEVLKTYFQIDSNILEEKAFYHPESQTYLYRPRGMYDTEFPYAPYPEVVAYEKQEDKTIKLTIEAVWTRKKLERAITSELVVRPLENGAFQYVSNRVVPTQDGIEPIWYNARLTDEEWKAYYGNKE